METSEIPLPGIAPLFVRRGVDGGGVRCCHAPALAVSRAAAAGGGGPVCVESKSMGVGEVFCVNFYPEDPYILACGGEDGKVALWETNESSQVSRRFRGRVRAAGFGASAAGVEVAAESPAAEE